ncbi:MAG TPA: hypothetical protein VNS58_13450 [Puia sp.]|nr:hypothetical protein [Puia sp.]
MKDKFDFYQDYYFRELNRRNEINSSLSIPIGLITALVGGGSYLLTNFEYHLSFWLTIPFTVSVLATLIFLLCAIYNLIKSYTNFPGRYDYVLIADNEILEKYRQGLKNYYAANPSLPDTSEEEFDQYLIAEMVKYTGINQKNNKRKTKFSYNCEKHLITALISIVFSLPFFSVNYGLKPEKKTIFNARVIPPGTLEIIQNPK